MRSLSLVLAGTLALGCGGVQAPAQPAADSPTPVDGGLSGSSNSLPSSPAPTPSDVGGLTDPSSCSGGVVTNPREKAPQGDPTSACASQATTFPASLADVAGRWVACSGDLFGTTKNGLELGGNSRFRMLTVTGADIQPSTDVREIGTIYRVLPGPAQLGLWADSNDSPYWTGTEGGDSGSGFPSGVLETRTATLDATGDHLRLLGPSPVETDLARIAPSAADGADIAPPMQSACSMVGTWDLTPAAARNATPALTATFDSTGGYTIGPGGGAACTTFGVYGTDPTHLWSVIVDGPSASRPGCGPTQYTATWNGPGCTSLQVSVNLGNVDNCMDFGPFGGFGGGTLTRR